MQEVAGVAGGLAAGAARVMLPRPPIRVPVAALDLMGGRGRAPEKAIGKLHRASPPNPLSIPWRGGSRGRGSFEVIEYHPSIRYSLSPDPYPTVQLSCAAPWRLRERSRAAFKLNAAVISERWVSACGKLPSASPEGPICSANRPRWVA